LATTATAAGRLAAGAFTGAALAVARDGRAGVGPRAALERWARVAAAGRAADAGVLAVFVGFGAAARLVAVAARFAGAAAFLAAAAGLRVAAADFVGAALALALTDLVVLVAARAGFLAAAAFLAGGLGAAARFAGADVRLADVVRLAAGFERVALARAGAAFLARAGDDFTAAFFAVAGLLAVRAAAARLEVRGLVGRSRATGGPPHP
jgi:hypothetical protein